MQLWRLGFVDLWESQELSGKHVRYVELTESGLATAEELRAQGYTPEQESLLPVELGGVRHMLQSILAERGLAAEDLPLTVSGLVESDPLKALRELLGVVQRS
jgi:hypothetical protein